MHTPDIMSSNPQSRFGLYVRQMRAYQWVKNLLILLPPMLAHRISDPGVFASAVLGFLSFSAIASAVYILNDIVDVENDRAHPRKQFRPLASRAITMQSAIAMVVVLLATGVGVAVAYLPFEFVLCLLTYMVVTTVYSFTLKRIVLVDAITLSVLYTLRIVAGGAATHIEVSEWLLGFSLFMFMSLAFLKRYVELLDTIERDGRTVSGRGYHVGDSQFVLVAGAALGYVGVLVFTLYVNAPHVQVLYHRPKLLWLCVPTIVYWISHVWLSAHRGVMHDDPIVFAARDVRSWAAGLVAVAIVVAASL